MIRRVSSVTSHTFAHIRGVFYAGGSECPPKSMKEERIITCTIQQKLKLKMKKQFNTLVSCERFELVG